MSHARSRKRLKRGGGAPHASLEEAEDRGAAADLPDAERKKVGVPLAIPLDLFGRRVELEPVDLDDQPALDEEVHPTDARELHLLLEAKSLVTEDLEEMGLRP